MFMRLSSIAEDFTVAEEEDNTPVVFGRDNEDDGAYDFSAYSALPVLNGCDTIEPDAGQPSCKAMFLVPESVTEKNPRFERIRKVIQEKFVSDTISHTIDAYLMKTVPDFKYVCGIIEEANGTGERDIRYFNKLVHMYWNSDVDIVTLMDSTYTDIHGDVLNHYRLFHHAAHIGNLNVIKWLLQQDSKIDLETKDSNAYTTLAHAAIEGHTELVDWLIVRANANVYTQDRLERSCLATAAGNGHWQTVRRLLASAPDLINIKCGQGASALHWACLSRTVGAGNCIKLILHYKGDVNEPYENGRSCLRLTGYRKNIGRGRMLMRRMNRKKPELTAGQKVVKDFTEKGILNMGDLLKSKMRRRKPRFFRAISSLCFTDLLTKDDDLGPEGMSGLEGVPEEE